jgi:site-specific DNA recombinase
MVLDAIVRSSREGLRDVTDMRSYVEQENDIRNWAERRGHTIGRVHVERDTSGKTTNRKALRDVRERIGAGDTQGLVVAYTSRFSRNVVEGMELALWILSDPKREFYSVEFDGIDFRSPSGEYILTNALAIARQEWAMRRAGFERSRKGAIERGIHLQERFGYRKGADRRLAPDEIEAPWVPRIFERRASGESWQRLANWLNDEGVKPHRFSDRRDGQPSKRKRGERWTANRIKQLIESPVYLGRAHSGDSLNGDAHPALVTRELWERANALRDLRPRRGREDYALSGLLISGVSGRGMVGNTTRKGERAYRYYGERQDTPAPRLDGRVKAETVERVVAEEWSRRVGVVNLYAVQRSGSLDTLTAERDELVRDREETERDLDLMRRRRAAWENALDEYDRRIAAKDDEIMRERSAVTGVMATAAEVADPLAASADRRRRLFAEAFAGIVVEADRSGVRVFGRDETPNRDGIGGRVLALA